MATVRAGDGGGAPGGRVRRACGRAHRLTAAVGRWSPDGTQLVFNGVEQR